MGLKIAKSLGTNRRKFAGLKAVSRTAIVASSISMCTLWLSSEPSGASTIAPMTLAQLVAATPTEPQVPLSPGQSVNLPVMSWVDNMLGQTWLTQAEYQYLINIPISVSEPSTSQLSVAAPSPFVWSGGGSGYSTTMSGQCTYNTIGGSWWYRSTLAFAYDGTHITAVGNPTDTWKNFFAAFYTSSFHHQFEATGSAHITYLDQGNFNWGDLNVANIYFYMNGDGSWDEISLC